MMELVICACGSNLDYVNCCEPYHTKTKNAPTAEALMRSRYTAFVMHNADYLYTTTHLSKRASSSKKSYLKSAKNTKWVKLEVISSSFDVVEFKAYYLLNTYQTDILHEKSNFKLEDGLWYYVDGEFY